MFRCITQKHHKCLCIQLHTCKYTVHYTLKCINMLEIATYMLLEGATLVALISIQQQLILV